MSAASSLRDYLMPFVGKGIGATLAATDEYFLLNAVNAALLDLLNDRQAEMRSEIVRAPANVTIDAVTNNSTNITFSGYQNYMQGCSIQIGSTWNRLVKPAVSVSLEEAYTGSTDTNVAATVYSDAVTLTYLIDSPMDPVTLNGQYPLITISERSRLEEFRAMRAQWPTLPLGLPQAYVMEDSVAGNDVPASRFLFDALPLEQYSLRFKAALRPTQITSWVGTLKFFLPGGRDINILWPVARYWLSTYPIFIGDRGEAKEDYAMAKMKWDAYTNKGSQPGDLDIHAC